MERLDFAFCLPSAPGIGRSARPMPVAEQGDCRVHCTGPAGTRHNAPVLWIYYGLFMLLYQGQRLLELLNGP